MALCLAATAWLGTAPVAAQPAPSVAATAGAELTPAERAQRDADKVFKWILIHSDKPRKAGAAREERRDDRPAVAARAKPATRPAEAASNAAPASTASSTAAEVVTATTQAAAPVAAPPIEIPSPAPTEPAAATVAALETRPGQTASASSAAVAGAALDEALTPLLRADPEFPSSLLRSLRKGEVRVRFTVLPDGSVAEPAVVASSNAKLNPSALAAIAKWRFAPVRRAQGGVVDLGFNLD